MVLSLFTLDQAQRSGIFLTSPGAAGAGGGAVINSEGFLKLQADQEKFAAQHVELYMRYLGRDSRVGELAFDQERANSIALQAKLDSITREHGDAYIEGIQPRHFDSSWNWIRQDALFMWCDIIFARSLPAGILFPSSLPLSLYTPLLVG